MAPKPPWFSSAWTTFNILLKGPFKNKDVDLDIGVVILNGVGALN